MANLWTQVLATCAALLAIPSGLVAQTTTEPSEATVTEWVKAEWARSADPLSLPGMRLDLEITDYVVVDTAKIEALRKLVQGFPDHPKRFTLMMLEQEAARSGKATRYSLWLWSNNNWRVNSSPPVGEYVDVTVTPSVDWTLNPHQLQVIAPDATPEHQNPSEFGPMYAGFIRVLHFGGFDAFSPIGLRVSGVAPAQGGHWMVHANSDTDLTVEYNILWSREYNRGFVQSFSEHHVSPDKASLNCDVRLTGWKSMGSSNQWLASEADISYPATGNRRRMVVSKATDCSNDEFQAVAAIPVADKPDPVRGYLTFNSIYDHRPGKDRAIDILGGQKREISLPPVVTPTPESTWRWYGWGTLALAAGCLAALRYARKSRVGMH